MAATKSRGGKRAGAARRSVSQLGKEDREGFGAWIARHLEWMRVRNYSEATVRTREPWLVVFAQWCEARGIQRPREVTKPILESYRRQLFYHRKQNGKALTFGSQRARLAPLKLFFGWMTRQNGLLWNPASELDLPRVEKRLPRALTEEEVERVLAQPALDGALGLRDRAVLEVLYSTGMRRSELVALRLSDVAATEGTVFVHQGKGKKDRVVPIGARALGWVARYLAEVRPLFLVDESEDALFLSESGARIEAGTLTHRVGRYVEAAKLGKRGSCHLFRHTMATLMLEGGADVRLIQEILGHASLDSTEVYTRVSIRHLSAVHAATHPAERGPGVASTTAASRSGATNGREAEHMLSSLAAEVRDELAAG
ncbi:MAG: site-specific tyrosine recombinase XerC [Polyangiaceae bacterium]|jgi:integrase/recombinase XerD|nr:site-specific tyrosine recombinase XerC [Polyangiaceae bacterium]